MKQITLGPIEINSQSVEDAGYTLQKYTLQKYTLQKHTLQKYTLQKHTLEKCIFCWSGHLITPIKVSRITP